MLEADKSKWFEKIFEFYNRNLIKRRFHSLEVSGIENLRNNLNKSPLITYANHSSWWDGLILYEIFSHFDFENYVLMEEKQLKNLQLFRKLGAFSIIREDSRKAVESINYAVKILKENPKANLWIFPQGKIQPNDVRPLNFFNGISKIILKSTDCNAIPVALRFEFLKKFKPECFVKIGEMKRFQKISKNESKTLTKSFQVNVESLLEDLKADIIKNKLQNYKKLI